jgi:uncharacterized damage-inducible protein DinB
VAKISVVSNMAGGTKSVARRSTGLDSAAQPVALPPDWLGRLTSGAERRDGSAGYSAPWLLSGWRVWTRGECEHLGTVGGMSADRFSTATEREALCSFLDQARDALIRKVDGLSDKDARRAATVSSLSLLSLLKHSAVWERRWFQIIFAGRSFPDEWPAVDEAADATFALSDEDTVESVLADYREQIAVSQEITASADLDVRCARTELVDQNLRWVAMHLIQETARHTGHADVIREAIDGSRGL